MDRKNSAKGGTAGKASEATTGGDQAVLPASPTKTAFRAGLISVNAGVPTLQRLIENPHLADATFIALDRNPLSLIAPRNFTNIPLAVEYRTHGEGTAHRNLTAAQQRLLTAKISHLDLVFVVVQLGVRHELSLAVKISNILRSRDIMAIGIAVLPFAYLNINELEQAKQGLRSLSRCLTTFPIAQDDFLRLRLGHSNIDVETNMTPQMIAQVLNVTQRDVPIAIEKLVYAVLAPELREPTVAYVFSDLIATLDGCALGAIGFGSSNSSQGLSVAFTSAINHPLLGRPSLQESSVILALIEAKSSGPLIRATRDGINVLQEAVGDQCCVMFTWIVDPNLSAVYQVTLLAGYQRRGHPRPFARMIVSGSSVSDPVESSVKVTALELESATALLQASFRPGSLLSGPVSFLQRHLRIGHHKGLAIVQALERAGVLSAELRDRKAFSYRRVL